MCIFCSIVSGELPASVIYEGETCIAILDLYPMSQGHVLVLPRRHCNDVTQLSEEGHSELFQVGRKVLRALRIYGLGRDGANYLLNDGSAANQHIPHLHLHIIPRRKGDLLSAFFRFFLRALGPLGLSAKRNKLDQLARELRPLIEGC